MSKIAQLSLTDILTYEAGQGSIAQAARDTAEKIGSASVKDIILALAAPMYKDEIFRLAGKSAAEYYTLLQQSAQSRTLAGAHGKDSPEQASELAAAATALAKASALYRIAATAAASSCAGMTTAHQHTAVASARENAAEQRKIAGLAARDVPLTAAYEAVKKAMQRVGAKTAKPVKVTDSEAASGAGDNNGNASSVDLLRQALEIIMAVSRRDDRGTPEAQALAADLRASLTAAGYAVIARLKKGAKVTA